MPPLRLAPILPCCALSLALCVRARADEAATVLQAEGPALPTIVVESSAVAGGGIDIDKIPGNVQILSSADLTREGSASLTNALNSSLGSVNINDDLVDPFQPDILFRGFEASPVLGTPQGLAVYQNGVRINEAFGDTVNWDLFPEIAINRVEIVSSSPVYGLNALGGGVSVTMKNGFNYDGEEVELSGGSYEQHSGVAQFGAHSDDLAFYVAGRALDWGGWREFSSDRIRQIYTALSARSALGSIDLSYSWADDSMGGQGPAPVQELAVNRALVFTGPQRNVNHLDFVNLSGNLKLADHWSLQGVLYYREYAQSVANGNSTDYETCTSVQYSASLCQPDGVTPLTNAAGQLLPDISDGGTRPIGENDYEMIHSYSRGATLQAVENGPLAGHDNQFTAGATVDYSLTHFYTGAQMGLINPDLLVLPSNLYVDTPESEQNAAAAAGNGNVDATPISLLAANKDYGVYATDTFDLAQGLAVTASGRYNIATIDLQDQLGANLTGDNRYVHFNPALGATYKLRPTLTLYGGIAENTRTPTASEIECSNPLQPCLLPSNLSGDPPTLRQVVAHTGELGLRGRIPLGASGGGAAASAGEGVAPRGGVISWNLSVFRTELHDDIYGIATSVRQGFFQNIGDTRRQGLEAGIDYRGKRWSAYANYSYIAATFESPLTVPSTSNPHQDANGDIHVQSGDDLPGIPKNRLKIGADRRFGADWMVGASVNFVGNFYFVGDASNQLAPISGYHVVNLHASYRVARQIEWFASIKNLFNSRYATWGILADPTGIGTPGVPANAVTNGPGVNTRFLSPGAPIEGFAGIRIGF